MAAQVTASPSDRSEAVARHRRALDVQRAVGQLASPICIPGATAIMRLGFRWRLRDPGPSRALYARLLAEDSRPLLIAANHLTMADSALIGWALGSTWDHLVRYRGLPWNVPEQSRVESSRLWRVLAYVMKCAPVPPGGERQEVARVLDGLRHLMQRGEVVMMFPEGGRSRSGRIDRESVAQGVGRVIKEVGDCRVLCVYLRGDRQDSWSHVPAVGDTFTVATRLVEPRTDLRGVRASRDLASQVLDHLVEMEQDYLGDR